MKIYHVVKGGLGDVLSEQFIPVSDGNANVEGRHLSRMLALWRAGKVQRVGIAYRSGHPNVAVADLFAGMGLQMLSRIGADWIRSDTLQEPTEVPLPQIPMQQPDRPIPRRFILFNENATSKDRGLHDSAIYRAIKDASTLPIVKVGIGRSQVPCDIDLTNRLGIREVAWLAHRATLIISAVTFHRCWTALFDKPVIELLDKRRATPSTTERTMAEYATGRYGMTPRLNHLLYWPNEAQALTTRIGQFASS